MMLKIACHAMNYDEAYLSIAYHWCTAAIEMLYVAVSASHLALDSTYSKRRLFELSVAELGQILSSGLVYHEGLISRHAVACH